MAQATLFDIRFEGLRQVQEQLERVQDLLEYNLRQAVARTVLWGAGKIAEDTPVDTGRLRASIGGDVIDTSAGGDPKAVAEGRRESLTAIQDLLGVIGTNVRYAIYQEFGWQPRGPRKLTRKQLRYLFAVGILRTVKTAGGRRVVPGDRTGSGSTGGLARPSGRSTPSPGWTPASTGGPG